MRVFWLYLLLVCQVLGDNVKLCHKVDVLSIAINENVTDCLIQYSPDINPEISSISMCDHTSFCSMIVTASEWNGTSLYNYITSTILFLGFLWTCWCVHDCNCQALSGGAAQHTYMLSAHQYFLFVCCFWSVLWGLLHCVSMQKTTIVRYMVHDVMMAGLFAFNICLELSLALFLSTPKIGFKSILSKIMLATTVGVGYFVGVVVVREHIDHLNVSPDPMYIFQHNVVLSFRAGFYMFMFFTYTILAVHQYLMDPNHARCLYYSSGMSLYYLVLSCACGLRVHNYDGGICLYYFCLFVYAGVFPYFFVYKTLLLDSMYWMNLAGRRQTVGVANRLANIITGVDLELDETSKTSTNIYIGSKFKANLVPGNQLYFHENIGFGGGGQIGRYTWQGTNVCVKKVFPSMMNREYILNFVSEAATIRQLKHKNIVTFMGIYFDPPHIGIIMELCGRGNLSDVLRQEDKQGLWDFTSPLQLGLDVAHAVAYIQEFDVVHRDIKGLNVFVTEDGVAKLCDFGTAIILGASYNSMVIGTPLYTAPETYQGDSAVFPTDVYATGMILWECLVWKVPYILIPMPLQTMDNNRRSLIEHEQYEKFPSSPIFNNFSVTTMLDYCTYYVVKCGYTPPIPENISLKLSDLMRRCWSREPMDRPCIREVVEILEAEVWASP
jgi:serine/threonine protein kinase